MSNYLSRQDHSLQQSFQTPLTDLFSSVSKTFLNKYPFGDLMHQEISWWAAALSPLAQTPHPFVGTCMGQRWGHDHCPTWVRTTSDEPLVIIASSGPLSLLHASEIQHGEQHHVLPCSIVATSSTQTQPWAAPRNLLHLLMSPIYSR